MLRKYSKHTEIYIAIQNFRVGEHLHAESVDINLISEFEIRNVFLTYLLITIKSVRKVDERL